MKVSINWLKELIDLQKPIEEIIQLLPLRTVGIKEISPDYFELDMKGYNRADLLSMRGIAYEIAAITGASLKFTENDNKFIWENQNLPATKIIIQNSRLCPLYCLAKIEGLKVNKSPKEWINKLIDCGMRSVNNITDITNLIMLEYGQPMHAFDADKIEAETLIVRVAKTEEEIITLDGKKRKLLASDLLIADPNKGVGIAGVMGGQNSEVTDTTTTILLEAAIFDPANLRATAKRLGLSSEASKRFQHGLTRTRLFQALDRAIRIYQDLGGQLVAFSIVGETQDQNKKLNLELDHLNSLIGFQLQPAEVKNYLNRLYFKLTPETDDARSWQVTIPYFRLDIECEADLIEEVARMYGYERIKPQPLSGRSIEKIDQSLFETLYRWKVIFSNKGLTEVQTYSFYSSKILDNMNFDKTKLIKIANPISSETEYMRNQIWPNLVEVASQNLKQGYKEIAVFEVGKIYQLQSNAVPKETYKLAMALSDSSDNSIQKLGTIFQDSYSNMSNGKIKIKQEDTHQELFHPVRFGKIIKEDKEIGFIAEIHPRILDRFGINQRVAVLEIVIFEV